MANRENSFFPSSTTPDDASVHVLYAGNLADDDFMWIVECTIEEFQKMLNSPVTWVRDLSLLPDWHYIGTQEPAPPAVLLKHFTMRIQQRNTDSGSDLITLQGISNTGIVTVRASQASAVIGAQNLLASRQASNGSAELESPSGATANSAPSTPLSDFWNEIAYDPNNGPTYKKVYAVNVDIQDSRYYGHFEICLPGQYDEQGQIAQTAAFILALGSDPQGFTSMLNSLNQSAFFISEAGVSQGNPITMQLPAGAVDQGLPILYTSLDENTAASCVMIDGTYNLPPSSPPTGSGGTGTVDNPVIKKYGVDDLQVPPKP